MMKKPKSFALFVVLLLLQQSFALRFSQKPLYATKPMLITTFDDDPDWGKHATVYAASQAAAQPAIDAIQQMVDTANADAAAANVANAVGGASKSATTILKGFKLLGAAFGALGAVFAVIDLFNPQPDPLDKVMEMMKGMEERILNEMGEKFAFLKNDNLKNLYNEAERHIKDAAKYLNRMSEAKQAKDEELYALFYKAFMQRIEASGVDDLEAIISIFSGETYFVSQPLLENLIDTYKGDYGKIDEATKAVTFLLMQAFLSLQTYVALSSEENPGLSDANKKLSGGIAKYQDETIEKLAAYVEKLETYQKEQLRQYLEANLKTFMTNNCKPQYQREQPCAEAITKQLDEAFGNLFKFTAFCMNKDVSNNDYKGTDMYHVEDVYNMNCAIFWSSPADSAIKSDPKELKRLGDLHFNYDNFEVLDQYVILPKDQGYKQWAGFSSTYISFDVYKSESSQKLVWARYQKREPGLCRLNIVNAVATGQNGYDRDDVVRYLDKSTGTFKLEQLGGDLNDNVVGLYFYGDACDTCSVTVFQEAYLKGESKIFYPEPSSAGLTVSKTGYKDTFLAKASSLQASCALPTSDCKFIFGEKSSQDQQDSFEFSLSSGQTLKENLYNNANAKRRDLNDNVSWLRLVGNCGGCRVTAHADPNYSGQSKVYQGTGDYYAIYQDSFLNKEISSYIAEC